MESSFAMLCLRFSVSLLGLFQAPHSHPVEMEARLQGAYPCRNKKLGYRGCIPKFIFIFRTDEIVFRKKKGKCCVSDLYSFLKLYYLLILVSGCVHTMVHMWKPKDNFVGLGVSSHPSMDIGDHIYTIRLSQEILLYAKPFHLLALVCVPEIETDNIRMKENRSISFPCKHSCKHS